jgi:hypothetical protein
VFPNDLALPPAPPRVPKHPRWVYNISFLPKYKNSRPEFPPNEPNSERTTRPLLLALFTCIYKCPLPLLNSPALLYTPALSSGTPGISTILPAKPKYPITNPNQPRHYGNTFKFWVVGNTRCGLMKSFRQVLGIDISGYHSEVAHAATPYTFIFPTSQCRAITSNQQDNTIIGTTP